MQKQKTGKISVFNFLDVKLKFLMSWVELIQFSVESSYVKLKIWATWLELNCVRDWAKLKILSI